jgi:hypothetical protein
MDGDMEVPRPEPEQRGWTPTELAVWYECKTLDQRMMFRPVVSTASNVGFKPMLAWAGRDGTLASIVTHALDMVHDPDFFEEVLPLIRMSQGGVVNHQRAAATLVVRLAAIHAMLTVAMLWDQQAGIAKTN